MAQHIFCKICGKRRAKRACPAVQGDICTICCGEQREVTLFCPLECPYLAEAHRREKTLPIAEHEIPHPEVEITEEFLRAHEELLLFSAYTLVQAMLRSEGAVDADLLEALAGLVQTHKTAESGLLYESISHNSVAAGLQRAFSASLADYQKIREEREGLSPVRNSDILKMLVFLHRIGQVNQNGRPKGRLYLDLLRQMTPETATDQREPSIIL